MPVIYGQPSEFRINGFRLEYQPDGFSFLEEPFVDYAGNGQPKYQGFSACIWRRSSALPQARYEWKSFLGGLKSASVTIKIPVETSTGLSWLCYTAWMKTPTYDSYEARFQKNIVCEFTELLPATCPVDLN